jgi:3-hydroxy-3-methylglutaryl CoA synthase
VTGIVGYAGYVPANRLRRADIAAALGATAGGERAVANYDEDTTTMAVAAAHSLVRDRRADIGGLWFATTDPAYVDKSNAATVHAALELRPDLPAVDLGASLRSGGLALIAAARDGGLAVLADRRGGPAGGVDERTGADAAAAFRFGDTDCLAEVVQTESVTAEFLDRWRPPGSAEGATWEERFGEHRYLDLLDRVETSLTKHGVDLASVDHFGVAGANGRAVRSASGRLARVTGADAGTDLAGRIGYSGTASVGLVLAELLDRAGPNQTLLVVSLADGADALVVRTAADIAELRGPALCDQLDGRRSIDYAQYLIWRGRLPGERPRRPDPERPSAPYAWRNRGYKLALTGGRCRNCGAVQFPLPTVCYRCHRAGDFESVDAAGQTARIVTFTVDHLAFSPSPPLISAIVAFDGGGRLQCELTDVDGDIAVGDVVEPTFRRGATVGGIHNYIWKARPRGGTRPGGEE